MTHVSISTIIRETVDQADGTFQAQDIAVAVVEKIDPDMYVTYLTELIVSRVSSEVGKLREQASVPARKGVSTKQTLIRDDYWPRFLAQMIALPSGYKALSDATRDDLIFIAQMRRSQANDLLGKAQQFEALAELMLKTGAKTLGRLDPQVGERTLAA